MAIVIPGSLVSIESYISTNCGTTNTITNIANVPPIICRIVKDESALLIRTVPKMTAMITSINNLKL